MLIKDLKQDCPRCQTTGKVAAFSQWGIQQTNIGGTCPDCKGRGYLPSLLGQDVLHFLNDQTLDKHAARLKELEDRLAAAQQQLESINQHLTKLEKPSR
ncbi:MAG: hypothetical protein OEV94_10190 [Deltaproteobacteria bacterium]|nr:hypothetical protein [Deltaproteobacteria bacterium]MDH4122061.1 hypothetical protein [Deltaproteobacteria bacterium]